MLTGPFELVYLLIINLSIPYVVLSLLQNESTVVMPSYCKAVCYYNRKCTIDQDLTAGTFQNLLKTNNK